MEIAKMAGVLEDQKGDGVQALGSFDAGEDDSFSSPGDEVDVKFYEDDDMTVRSNSLDGFQGIDGEGAAFDPDESITRMDGNNDVAKWGD
ncbi:hypothetical protein TrRE_jg4607 [Triparma retinervis]|uniref:Uncharacterized protein n=1 Tax=Triparma retinervis TaxID=2557542 RepID=A0A9W7DVE1_9STRA|nr:hypothetical protein TrRE_jg4607 [Triparma retinervis]